MIEIHVLRFMAVSSDGKKYFMGEENDSEQINGLKVYMENLKHIGG